MPPRFKIVSKVLVFTLLLQPVLAASVPAQPSPNGAVAPPPTPPAISVPDDARRLGLESLRLAAERDGGPPLPENLARFVRDRQAALQLGKALFWDMQTGSDGVQACASCHFSAGADSRPKNQLTPDFVRVANQREGEVIGFFRAPGAPDNLFEIPTGAPSVIGPNYRLAAKDFPFVRSPNKWIEQLTQFGPVAAPDFKAGNSNDVASSMGVLFTDFLAVIPGDPVDQGQPLFDPVFNVRHVTTRRVEPRNSPTTINAIFNFTNFWDGRANANFNGATPFGRQDPDAGVFFTQDGGIVKRPVVIFPASLASQAVGPPLSGFEMSFGGRAFPHVGRKLLNLPPLARQRVAHDDSVLGALALPNKGIATTYPELIKKAFRRTLWDSDKLIRFDPAAPTGFTVLSPDEVAANPGEAFSLMEANFSLFWGLSILIYEATLVSDRSPFDRWMEGDGSPVKGFGKAELSGLNLFVGKGRCVNCHSGPEFTNASVRNARNGRNVIEPMQMAQGFALYDNGFYNIGVTLTTDDIGRGGADPFGAPLAFSRQALFERLDIQDIPFPIFGNSFIPAVTDVGGVSVCTDLNGDGFCRSNEPLSPTFRRAAVDGAFRTPTLRNVELTGPYFHNGGLATLKQAVQFYDRGGNFCRFNLPDLDPDIRELGLLPHEEDELVAFLISLTDQRVRTEAAPFDHPELLLPGGHPGDENAIAKQAVFENDGILQAADAFLRVRAIGAGGGNPLPTFLNLSPHRAIFTPFPDPCFSPSGEPR